LRVTLFDDEFQVGFVLLLKTCGVDGSWFGIF
jgi:hypothetical protein